MGILLGNFLKAVGQLLGGIVNLLIFLLIARAVLSWVNPDPNNAIVRFINGSTDPLIDRVRRFVPPLGMFDVSVIIVIFALYFLDTFLVGSILAYGEKLLLSGMGAGAL